MSIDDFMEGVHILQDNYHKKLTTEQLRLFYEHLKDMDKKEYLKNIEIQIDSNPFMPNIAQIRNEQISKYAYANYEQRDYKDIDFDSLYAN